MMSHHETARPNPGIAAPARRIFEYLCLRDRLPSRADVIVGFGHFDPRIPRRCCELYGLLHAQHIVFTGGRGNGSADLTVAEARYFLERSRAERPGIPPDTFSLDTVSTNTGENVRNTLTLLEGLRPVVGPLESLTVVLVANAYRQRRVWLTWRTQALAVACVNAPPQTTFEREQVLFAEKGQDLCEHLAGEVERLERYGERGYIERAPVAPEVLKACARVREAQAGH